MRLLKMLFLVTLVGSTGWAVTASAQTNGYTTPRPNLLLIVVDDKYYGSPQTHQRTGNYRVISSQLTLGQLG